MYPIPGVQNVETAQRDVSKEKKQRGDGVGVSFSPHSTIRTQAWNRLKKILINFFLIVTEIFGFFY